MNTERLTAIGHDIIKDEKLPACEFVYRSPMSGTKIRQGQCRRKGISRNKYIIVIYMTAARYFEDAEYGTYRDETGQRLRRATIGKERSDKEIISTFAHEIAHLKHFDHSKEFKEYHKVILKKVNEKLRRNK